MIVRNNAGPYKYIWTRQRAKVKNRPIKGLGFRSAVGRTAYKAKSPLRKGNGKKFSESTTGLAYGLKTRKARIVSKQGRPQWD